jgi:DNA polymerase IV (archaeal DinB-like DNA polymerase)
MDSKRIILHLDMDYFYAQIEERENPGLRDKAVAICMVSNRQGSLGAIATCNYHARKLGLHSGMPCFIAKKKAPDGVYLPARREYYRMVSDSIMEVLAKFCDVLEQVSVDEAYMDVTKRTGYERLDEYIRDVKDAVYSKERLTCSVGAGPNKLIAKMASSAKKPDGHTIIKPDEAQSFLENLPASKLHGVGGKTTEILDGMGVKTVRDLRNIGLEELTARFGQSRGKALYDGSRGEDDSPVAEREKEQYGRLASLKTDTRDEAELYALIDSLSGDVHARLVGSGMEYRTVSGVFILEDMSMRTRSRTLPAQTQSRQTLTATAKTLVKEFLAENQSRIRRLGVTASNLTPSTGQKALTDY